MKNMNNNSNMDVTKMSLTTENNLKDLFNEFKKDLETLESALKIADLRVKIEEDEALTAAIANPDAAKSVLGQINYAFSTRVTPESADLRGGNNLPAMAFSVNVAGV